MHHTRVLCLTRVHVLISMHWSRGKRHPKTQDPGLTRLMVFSVDLLYDANHPGGLVVGGTEDKEDKDEESSF